MKKLNYLSLLFTLFLISNVFAQDVHFSQYYQSAIAMNPTMTANMNSDARVSLIYRNQWSSVLENTSFKTVFLQGEVKIPVGRADFIGIGGFIYSDRAGASSLTRNKFNVSFSYFKNLAENKGTKHYLVGGLGMSLQHQSINAANLTFSNQFNGVEFDPTLGSGENILVSNRVVGEVSAGVLWYSLLKQKHHVYFGGAVNVPLDDDMFFLTSFNPANYTRIQIMTGASISSSTYLSWKPGVIIYMQGPSMMTYSGLRMRLDRPEKEKAYVLGLWYRGVNAQEKSFMSDGISLAAHIEFHNFKVGFNYDMNISSARLASQNLEAIEISAQYNFNRKKKRSNKVYCPVW